MAVGSLGLTGCKGITALGPVPKVSGNVLALEQAIAAEEVLISRYQLALGHQSGGGGRQELLTTIQAEHEAHLHKLRSALVVPPKYATSKLRTGPGSAPALPGGTAFTLAALASDERAAVVRLTAELLDAPAPLAQLLASIAAAEAAHVVYLRKGGSRSDR